MYLSFHAPTLLKEESFHWKLERDREGKENGLGNHDMGLHCQGEGEGYGAERTEPGRSPSKMEFRIPSPDHRPTETERRKRGGAGKGERGSRRK